MTILIYGFLPLILSRVLSCPFENSSTLFFELFKDDGLRYIHVRKHFFESTLTWRTNVSSSFVKSGLKIQGSDDLWYTITPLLASAFELSGRLNE